jgi:hypothetical protein
MADDRPSPGELKKFKEQLKSLKIATRQARETRLSRTLRDARLELTSLLLDDAKKKRDKKILPCWQAWLNAHPRAAADVVYVCTRGSYKHAGGHFRKYATPKHCVVYDILMNQKNPVKFTELKNHIDGSGDVYSLYFLVYNKWSILKRQRNPYGISDIDALLAHTSRRWRMSCLNIRVAFEC